jgi:hypothetical protein
MMSLSAVERAWVPASRGIPSLPPIKLDSSPDKKEDDAVQEARHLAMARRNSLTAVVTDMWEKAKRAFDADEEEARDIQKEKWASICSELTCRSYVIVDYLDDESDFSADVIDEDDTDDEDM